MEKRKEEEAVFHDLVRDKNLENNSEEFNRLTSNRKFYSVIRKSWAFTENWLDKRCKGKKVLDYCCGDGALTILLAKKGAAAYGIDISPISIENAKRKASSEGVSENTFFSVNDAENMSFDNNYFDVIICHGVLHHLDTKKAFPELARVLKSSGQVICVEPLSYNPVFQLYRKLTPHLRTEWEAEHILNKNDIAIAQNSFGNVEIRFFHLLTLMAVPLRNSGAFKYALGIFENIDNFLLKVPFLKWWAWQVIFILSSPKKETENRKKIEIGYYDEKAERWLQAPQKKWDGDFEGFSPFVLSSYRFLQEYLKDKCRGKKILDYGCGNGVHYPWLVKFGGEVVGIDLSEKSLEIAKKIAEKEKISDKAKFLAMDCEKLEFPDNSFDIVFDGGTFSSLDIDKAYKEIKRVLKKDGFLIGIETFGHNPFTNLKRQFNKITGKRTRWAASHIFNNKDIKKADEFFGKKEVFYFHSISWLAIPFLKISAGRRALKILEFVDGAFSAIPFIKNYSFKVVFVFSNPKK